MRKIALVTGGARRLGRQIVYFLADEGFDVAIMYNSTSRMELNRTAARLRNSGARFRFYKCDIRNINVLQKTILRIGKDFRRIDLLINNAGIIKKVKFKDITEHVYDDIMAVNLRAALFTCQSILPYLLKSSNPLIINLASLGGIKNWVDYFPYCISKAGMIKLTFLLAKQLAPRVRVNAIAPGTILIEGEEKDDIGRISLKNIPLAKYGKPEDITGAVGFLINCEYITGQVIVIDGGRTVT